MPRQEADEPIAFMLVWTAFSKTLALKADKPVAAAVFNWNLSFLRTLGTNRVYHARAELMPRYKAAVDTDAQ